MIVMNERAGNTIPKGWYDSADAKRVTPSGLETNRVETLQCNVSTACPSELGQGNAPF